MQAIILRENGYICDDAVVYYNATKQRVRVRVDNGLVSETILAVASARAVAESGRIPPPLEDSPKCLRCSLVPICLPDETRSIMGLDRDPPAQGRLFDTCDDPGAPIVHDAERIEEVRQLVPARDDLRPLFVIGQGLTIGRSGAVLQIARARGKARTLVQEARVADVSQVDVFGSVQLHGGGRSGPLL